MIQFKFLILLFVSLSASAEVKVGDMATYKITYSPGDPSFYSLKKLEVTEISSDARSYTFKESFISNGKLVYEFLNTARISDSIRSESDYNRCEIDNIGKYETVVVPAGSFTACHITFRPIPSLDPEEFYLAKVPFAIVKKHSIVSSASGITYDEELVSFKKY